ncbi:MAG TPA: hypothetical protein VIT89_03730 [Solirubrobacterales bacterium]
MIAAVAVVTAHFGPTSTAKPEAREDAIDARIDAREARAKARQERREEAAEAHEGEGDGSCPGYPSRGQLCWGRISYQQEERYGREH